jgi:glutamate synthase (NADPH/NADH) small chain
LGQKPSQSDEFNREETQFIMGKETGFLEVERRERDYIAPEKRLKNYSEFIIEPTKDVLREQASRCMNCGIPYCHNGCPVNNSIPDWNHLVYEDDWKNALAVLHSTNNFPEFTGRICPAPCEAACTLNITDEPVTIKSIECAIVDRGWDEGWIEPVVPEKQTGKSVAVVGSGPAGLACAQQLARAGHAVTVFEKSDRIGGLLRYGIPDFKMEKQLINRRAVQMEAEGVHFRTNAEVGVDISFASLRENYDAVVMAGGAEEPRQLEIPGAELSGVRLAMEFLTQQNKRNAGDDEVRAAPRGTLSAKGKHVIVIGGGDTGSDCVGTSNRQGAASVTQLEIMPKPPEHEDKALTWPDWPVKLRTSSSHEEGAERDWSVLTKRVIGANGDVTGLECVRIEWDGRNFSEVEGSEFILKADLIFLAMGFVGPKRRGMLDRAGVKLDERGNVAANVTDYATSEDNVFACGDMRRGQSLVVWAIREGRQAARSVDEALMGVSELPR